MEGDALLCAHREEAGKAGDAGGCGVQEPAEGIEPDILNIKIQPTEGVYLQFNIKTPGETEELTQAKMDFCQNCNLVHRMNTPEAYERLLGACMRGERSWFSQWDQVEISWKYVDQVREQYRSKGLPVYEYEQEGSGPAEADSLLNGFGHKWFE